MQTYSPDHPAIRLAARHDFVGFAAEELPMREMYGVPPYGRIVRVIARGPAEATVQSYMNDLAAAFRAAADPSVRILGPAPAPIIKIRNLYRFHLQLRCPKSKPLQVLTATVPSRHPAPAQRRSCRRCRPDLHALIARSPRSIGRKNREFRRRITKVRFTRFAASGYFPGRSFTPRIRDGRAHG